MVASLAAHGLLLAWFSTRPADFPEPAGTQMVMVEMLPVGPLQHPVTALPQNPRPAVTHDDVAAASVSPGVPSGPMPEKKHHAPPASETSVTEKASTNRVETQQASASQAGQRDEVAVRERLERFKYYPSSARRRGIAGDVEVGFQLRPDGMAEKVLVVASSGYEVLDRAAVETVSRAQPFPAGSGRYQFRLRFQRL